MRSSATLVSALAVAVALTVTSDAAAQTVTQPVTPTNPPVVNPPTPPITIGTGPIGRPITIGEGPVLGQSGGLDVHEIFRDWDIRDVRALDAAGDAGGNLADGADAARDLLAVYSRITPDFAYFRVDLLDLGFGSEGGDLNLGILIDVDPGSGNGQSFIPDFVAGRTAHPWELALLLYDGTSWRALDASWAELGSSSASPQLFAGAHFRADLDGVEVGFATSLLRGVGWDGRSALSLQVYTTKDGQNALADAATEVDLADGVLDEAISSRAKIDHPALLAPVVEAATTAERVHAIKDRIHNLAARTPEGRPSGYRRLLETHRAFGVPVTLALSGSFAAEMEWAADVDPDRDGPGLNGLIRDFLDGDPTNGEGALTGTVFSDHPLPYFENGSGKPGNSEMIRVGRNVLRAVYGDHKKLGASQVFWIPERIVRGLSIPDILTFHDGTPTGYTHAVVDQDTHLRTWLGAAEAAAAGNKVNRWSGLDLFAIDETAQAELLAGHDGGPSLGLRRRLLAEALQPDAERAVVVTAHWDELAGRPGPNGATDRPDQWERVIGWIANHPWVEVTTLEHLARRGLTPIDRGNGMILPNQAHKWILHASEDTYDNWVFGHTFEETFRFHTPTIRHGGGRQFSREIGILHADGTLLADVFRAIQAAPAGRTRDLALLAYSNAAHHYAWHQEDNHDTRRDPATGDWLNPDVTRDYFSMTAYGYATHAGEAAVIAAAARWAAGAPSPSAVAEAADLDLDGEDEWVLRNDRVYAVLERDGGRLLALFARDAATGEAVFVAGSAPVTGAGDSSEAGWEGDTNGNALRNSLLKDWWAAGVDTNGYVNDVYAVDLPAPAGGVATVRLRSSDGLIEKTVTLADGADQLEVVYDLDAAISTLYLRGGFTPDLAGIVTTGHAGLAAIDDGTVLRMTRTDPDSGRIVEAALHYADAGHAATLQGQATDGGPDQGGAPSSTDLAFTRTVEWSGAGRFGFAIGARVR